MITLGILHFGGLVMNKKKIFSVLIGIAVLIVIINVVVTKGKPTSTSTSEKMYTEKEYNKLVDEHFEETQKLKSDMSILETEKKSLDAQVKKLKDELAKKEQQVAQQPVQQEQPKQEPQQPAQTTQPEKKEEPKPEQPTGAFANPVKSINKTEAMNKVKEKAKQDFQDDYMTQNFVADEQSKAFDFLNGIEIKSQEELNVMKKAIGDFPNDFMTAKFVYEEQMKAKNKQG
jgi:FtsZ-interacting cell division protein ZipA